MKSSCIGATLPGEWSITEEAEAPILAVREAKSRRRKERRQHQESSGNKIRQQNNQPWGVQCKLI